MYETTTWIGGIIIEMYIESNVAVTTGKVREFGVVWKVVTLIILVSICMITCFVIWQLETDLEDDIKW